MTRIALGLLGALALGAVAPPSHAAPAMNVPAAASVDPSLVHTVQYLSHFHPHPFYRPHRFVGRRGFYGRHRFYRHHGFYRPHGFGPRGYGYPIRRY